MLGRKAVLARWWSMSVLCMSRHRAGSAVQPDRLHAPHVVRERHDLEGGQYVPVKPSLSLLNDVDRHAALGCYSQA